MDDKGANSIIHGGFIDGDQCVPALKHEFINSVHLLMPTNVYEKQYLLFLGFHQIKHKATIVSYRTSPEPG